MPNIRIKTMKGVPATGGVFIAENVKMTPDQIWDVPKATVDAFKSQGMDFVEVTTDKATHKVGESAPEKRVNVIRRAKEEATPDVESED